MIYELLRANEVAELDPYNVRGNPKVDGAKELLEKELSEGFIRRYEGFIPESSELKLADVLTVKGYQWLNIVGEEGEYAIIISDERSDRIINHLNNFQELQILSKATNFANGQDVALDFRNVKFEPFKDSRNQQRLQAYFYLVQKNELVRRMGRGLHVDYSEIEYLSAKISKALAINDRTSWVVPTDEEISNWINTLVTSYLQN